ncbi:MAG: hypothetical protein HY226_00370 [Candidatus Vogelbacteria bacterium]|nr:hypothetical protein [Candidatus Vogelbacteria bacterium]
MIKVKIQWVTYTEGKILEPYVQALQKRNMLEIAGPVPFELAENLVMPRIEYDNGDGIRRREEGLFNCTEVLQKLLSIKKSKVWSRREIIEMWPQAAGELRGFKRALEVRAGITASQLDMALQLAEKEFKRLLGRSKTPKE